MNWSLFCLRAIAWVARDVRMRESMEFRTPGNSPACWLDQDTLAGRVWWRPEPGFHGLKWKVWRDHVHYFNQIRFEAALHASGSKINQFCSRPKIDIAQISATDATADLFSSERPSVARNSDAISILKSSILLGTFIQPCARSTSNGCRHPHSQASSRKAGRKRRASNLIFPRRPSDCLARP